jgi:hypothetical protein
MRTLVATFAAAIAWTVGDLAHAAPVAYIVTFKAAGPGAVPAARVGIETGSRERALGFRARLRYRTALRGFAADLSERDAERLRHDPEVASVTRDSEVRALAAVARAPGEAVPTGIARIGSAGAN